MRNIYAIHKIRLDGMGILIVKDSQDKRDVPGILGMNIIQKSVGNFLRKSLAPLILGVLKRIQLYRVGSKHLRRVAVQK